MSQADRPAPGMLDHLARWLDDRLRLAEGSREYLRKAFPAHWSFLVGEVALFSLIVLVFTGTFIALFYVPSAREVVYDGPYTPLIGQEVSAAFDSVMRLSFEVRAGLLMRQIHHWAALVFVAAIVVHMLRVFFTGAFRRPRELNWVIGVTLLLLAVGAGFTGYSLPDDLLSGTGLRIGYSVLLSVPVVGPLLGFIGIGGEYPGVDVLGRLHVMHVMLLPAGLVALVAAHLAILVRQKHAQKAGPKATEENVVGEPLFPNQTLTSLSLFAMVIAVLSLLGGLFEINPVWLYGPYEPAEVFAPAQPDWYMGWLEGLLRLWPAWEFTILGVRIPSVFLPGVVVPGLMFVIVYAWPWLEARYVTGDTAEHHLLQRPRDVPMRTAIGSGGVALFVVIFVAGSNDVIAAETATGLQALTNLLRAAVFVVPPLVGWIAYRIAVGLQRSEPEPGAPTTGGTGARSPGQRG